MQMKLGICIALPVCVIGLLLVIIGGIGGQFMVMQSACDTTGDGTANNSVDLSADVNRVAAREVPKEFLPLFVKAGEKYKVYWQVVAGIAKEECDFGKYAVAACKITHGSDELGPANSAGASGLMQIGIGGGATNMWGTYGVDGNQDGHSSPHNPEDAIPAAANILRKAKNMPAAPASLAAIRPAIRGYNGAGPLAEAYADRVLAHAKRWGIQPNQALPSGGDATADENREDDGRESQSGCAVASQGDEMQTVAGAKAKILGDGRAVAPEEAPQSVKKMIEAGNKIHTKPYVWGGAHGMFPLDKIWPGYDCSSSTSHVLHAGNVFGQYAWVSGQFETYGKAGEGKWVTTYANAGHVFVKVAGIFMNTDHGIAGNPPGTGPRWITENRSNRGVYVVRHPEGL